MLLAADALAAAPHHSAQPRAREREAHATHDAVRGQKEPSPGPRLALLAEVAGPQRSDRTVRHSARDTPLSVVPTLRGDDGVEGTTVSYLLSAALPKMKKEK